jgi:hypothetical protein
MRTSVAITNSSSTRRVSPTCPIDRSAAAEAILALLAGVNAASFPPEERLAVGEVRTQALTDWLDAASGDEDHCRDGVAETPGGR